MNHIITAFSVPIVTTMHSSPDDLNRRLTAAFLAAEGEGSRYANPEPFTHRNDALFESVFTLFDWNKPEVQELKRFCYERLWEAVQQLNGHDESVMRRLEVDQESWFHITRKGGYFGVHNHPMHSWSGVYCVCQEGDENNDNSGRLTFINPFASNTMFLDMGSNQLQPPYQMGSIPTRLKPGQLVLFPSWLLHEVTSFEPESEGLRITVAFNVRFRMTGAQRHVAFS